MRWFMVVLCALALFVGGCKASSEIDSDGDAKSVAQQDAELAREVQKSPEARQWLAGADHGMFEISKQDASDLVESVYAAGAPKVYMLSPEVLQGKGEIGSTIVIEMPEDKAARKKIMDTEAAWWKKHGEEQGTPDEGQKYLEVFTD